MLTPSRTHSPSKPLRDTSARRVKRYFLFFTLISLLTLSAASLNASMPRKLEAPQELPNLGEGYSRRLSPQQERELGRAVMRRIRQQLPLIDDPEINDYLQAVGNRLANQALGSSHTFTLFVLDDRAINAFAAPGGYIGINAGLFLATESESELAGVIAHEISHITQGHFARRLENIERMTLPRAAAFVTALLLATVDPQLAMATFVTSGAYLADQQLSISRMNEREADRIGLGILIRAGFAPEGMSDFFKKLQRASQLNHQPIDFLSTHPLTEERMADMLNRLRQLPALKPVESEEYALMYHRLAVLFERSPSDALKSAREQLSKAESPSIPLRYRYAFALLRDQQPELAHREFTQLIHLDGERLTYLIGLHNALFQLNRIEEARKLFEQAHRLYPHQRSLIENHAQQLLHAQRYKEAFELLRPYLQLHSGTPRLYLLASQAAMKSDRQADGYRYLAEHHFELASYSLALESLDRALQESRTAPLEAESHLARKREISLYLQKELGEKPTSSPN